MSALMSSEFTKSRANRADIGSLDMILHEDEPWRILSTYVDDIIGIVSNYKHITLIGHALKDYEEVIGAKTNPRKRS